jgi:serine O-acetyltransferase
MKKILDEIFADIQQELVAEESCASPTCVRRGITRVGRQAVVDVLEELISILFPGCHREQRLCGAELPIALESIALTLREQFCKTFEYQCQIESCPADCHRCDDQAQAAVAALMRALPAILRTLQCDIQAAYDGDPAAASTMEVVMSYPGVYAVIVHRIAHQVYQLGVPLISRVMSEHAHSKTGIDIHPGAKIGSGFFIDHGTGVVIGETCVIGQNVKLYQGVTLGALSFEKDENGRVVKGGQRHPRVEDHVVIYAGATILGGDTVIGSHSEIGGNVWLTHSVPPGSKVYNQQPSPLVRAADGARSAPSGRQVRDSGSGI